MKYVTFNKNIIQKISLVLAVVLLFSCKKGYFYDGINDDPSQLKNPQPSSLLPGVIQATGYIYGGDASRFPSNFVQYVTGAANQSVLANTYQVSADDVDNMWTGGFYGGGIMNNIHVLITLGDSLKQYHYAAVGRILMANSLGTVTDMWGDVPYSDAFKGIASLQPKYDSQKQVYDTLFSLLDKAIADLSVDDNSPFQPGDDDLLYGGDLDMWLKFAHSLKAKYYLHLVKQDASNYDKALAEIPDGFSADGEHAGVPFSGKSIATENPWSQFNSQRGDIDFSGLMFDKLIGVDPRFDVYFDTSDYTDYGVVYLNSLYGSANSSVFLMSYDELKFVEAEAQFYKKDYIAAAAAYNEAVRANLVRTVKSTAYLSQVSKTAATLTLNDIMEQKYIALFLCPEAWTDWRRTGLPAITATPGSALGGQLPRSLLYPSGEQRYNTNAPKNTSMSRRVWWDKQ